MSLNLLTRELAAGRVCKVDTDIEPVIVELKFADGDTLICTPSQRLYCTSDWHQAGAIQPGMEVAELKCIGVSITPWNKEVFTLVVERWNNYCVLTDRGFSLIAHDNSSDLGYPVDFSSEQTHDASDGPNRTSSH